jgi:hypothetical protein
MTIAHEFTGLFKTYQQMKYTLESIQPEGCISVR